MQTFDEKNTERETRIAENITTLFDNFKELSPIFTALADSVRQTLLAELMKAGTKGMNVGDLTAKTQLSRPAISHHLKVLKDCGVIVPHKVATQVFYYFRIGKYIKNLKVMGALLEQSIENIDVEQIKKEAPWILD